MLAILSSPRRVRQQLAVPLYRNAIFLMASAAMNGIFGLTFWVLAAKFYDAPTVGLASAGISAMVLLATLGTLGLDYAIIRFLPRSANGTRMTNTTFTVGALAATVISLVFVAGLGLWSPVLIFIRSSALSIVGFVVFTAAQTVCFIQTRTFVARRRAEFSLAQSAIFNTLRVGMLGVMALWFGAFGVVSAWGISIVLTVGLGLLFFQPRLEANYVAVPTISGGTLHELIRYSFTNFAAAMLWTAPGYVLPLLVANLVGTESNAHFYIAWSMASILFQLPLAISFSLFAEGSCDEENLVRDVRRSLVFSLLAISPVILLLALFGKMLLGYFEPGYAENAADLLRLLTFSAIPVSINCIYFAVERVRMRMPRIVVMNAFLAVTTLALSWVLLPRMGINGAGIAWIASQSAAALAIVILHLRRRQARMSESQRR